MTNETNPTLASTFADSNGGTKTFYKDIVEYRSPKTDAETKAKMDAIMAKIDSDDLSTITSFGKEPSDTLKASAESVLKETTNATTFLGAFGSLKQKMKDFDFDTVAKASADYVEQLDRKMALMRIKSPLFRGLKKGINWATGLGKKDTSMDDIRHGIDASLLELADVVADLQGAKDKIPAVLKNLNKLEKARLEAYSDFGLYLGAGLEKLTQLEEALPALRIEAEGSPLKLAELSNKEDARTTLNTQLTMMDEFHKVSLGQLKTINDLQRALAQCEQKINSHLTLSETQWKSLLSEAAVAAQVGDLAETVQTAEEFGKKVFEQSQSVADLTRAMVQSSYGAGTIGPDKVVEFLKKKTSEIAEDLTFIDAHNDRMVQQRAELDQAGRDLVAAATKMRDAKPIKASTGTAAIAAPAIKPQQ